MNQLTVLSSVETEKSPAPRGPISGLAFAETREVARQELVERLYRKIPFKLACDLHSRLVLGDNSPETKQMLREAIVMARFNQPAH